MDFDAVKKYLLNFEYEVIVAGVEKKMFTKRHDISIVSNKLEVTDFGAFIGGLFIYSNPLAIDYYGFIKKSYGLLEVIEKMNGSEEKSINTPIVHFASVKTQDIEVLSPDLLSNFFEFKKYLLKLRGLK